MARIFLAKPPKEKNLAIDTRLKSMDERGRRVFFHPLEVTGKFRLRRDFVYAFLVLFFLVLPWIRIGGDPILLFDIPKRHFIVLTGHFYAHDAPFVFFALISFVLGLFLVTAIWGRIWCGWACPQTVFIEGVYRRIERWVEGPAAQRRILEQTDLNFQKAQKKLLKYSLYLIVTLLITHSFLAYFVDIYDLLKMMTKEPAENWTAFVFVMVSTGILYFNFTYFREQFCIIMCPYGRLQSVLLDQNSQVVAYDTNRSKDCINCFRCVQVCPTGIDIRNGTQMECISCTACIDACHPIMEKLKRPTGLIRYTTSAELQGKAPQKFRPRTFLYLAAIAVVLVGLGVSILSRRNIDVILIKKIPVNGDISKGPLLNQFFIEAKNSSSSPEEFAFTLSEKSGDLTSKEWINEPSGIKMVFPENPLRLEAGNVHRMSFFVEGALRAGLFLDVKTSSGRFVRIPINL